MSRRWDEPPTDDELLAALDRGYRTWIETETIRSQWLLVIVTIVLTGAATALLVLLLTWAVLA